MRLTVPSGDYSRNIPTASPREVYEKLYAAAKALQLPEVRAQLAKIELAPAGESPESSVKRLADEARVFSDIACKSGMKPQANYYHA